MQLFKKDRQCIYTHCSISTIDKIERKWANACNHDGCILKMEKKVECMLLLVFFSLSRPDIPTYSTVFVTRMRIWIEVWTLCTVPMAFKHATYGVGNRRQMYVEERKIKQQQHTTRTSNLNELNKQTIKHGTRRTSNTIELHWFFFFFFLHSFALFHFIFCRSDIIHICAMQSCSECKRVNKLKEKKQPNEWTKIWIVLLLHYAIYKYTTRTLREEREREREKPKSNLEAYTWMCGAHTSDIEQVEASEHNVQ